MILNTVFVNPESQVVMRDESKTVVLIAWQRVWQTSLLHEKYSIVKVDLFINFALHLYQFNPAVRNLGDFDC
jgi:hypothetical protein